LSEIATARGRITYSSGSANSVRLRLNTMIPGLAFLGEVSEDEMKAGRGNASAIIVHSMGHANHGPGFYELAKRLGKKVLARRV